MTNLIARILTPLSLAVLLCAGTAQAQIEQRVIHVNVPFEFTVGDKAFPAGDYSFVRIAPGRLDLRNSEDHVLLSLLTHSVELRESSPATKLKFSSVAGGHALTQVWVENETVGYELAAPKTSIAFAKHRSNGTGLSAGAGTK